MKIKLILRRMLSMTDAAWYIYIRTLQLSCFILFMAVILLIESETRGGSYELYMTAKSLFELPQAVLLIGSICSVCAEDLLIKRGP